MVVVVVLVVVVAFVFCVFPHTFSVREHLSNYFIPLTIWVLVAICDPLGRVVQGPMGDKMGAK